MPLTQMVSPEPIFQNIPAGLMEALLEASVVEAQPVTTLRSLIMREREMTVCHGVSVYLGSETNQVKSRYLCDTSHSSRHHSSYSDDVNSCLAYIFACLNCVTKISEDVCRFLSQTVLL